MNCTLLPATCCVLRAACCLLRALVLVLVLVLVLALPPSSLAPHHARPPAPCQAAASCLLLGLLSPPPPLLLLLLSVPLALYSLLARGGQGRGTAERNRPGPAPAAAPPFQPIPGRSPPLSDRLRVAAHARSPPLSVCWLQTPGRGERLHMIN